MAKNGSNRAGQDRRTGRNRGTRGRRGGGSAGRGGGASGGRRRSGSSGGGGGKTFYLAIATVVVVGVAWLLFMRDGGTAQAGPEPVPVAATSVEADPDAGTAVGPADAPVTIKEFADFQCPHCREFNRISGVLLRQNFAGPEGPVRWITYEFPLGFTNSTSSAIAAGCAEAQGRYWDMHDLLFARQDEWARDQSPRDKYEEYAERLGLDMNRFESCLEEREPLPRIMASHAYGEQLGVTGTPTVFVNGELARDLSYEGLAERIQDARTAAERDAGGAVEADTAVDRAGAGSPSGGPAAE